MFVMLRSNKHMLLNHIPEEIGSK
uniref:Uncharacterized protein n=1 Tax=Arundo donax TaxID=35708 RepID=A0A0A9CRC5_ARUDO